MRHGNSGSTSRDLIDLTNILPAVIEALYSSHTQGNTRDKMTLFSRALENLIQQKKSSAPKLRRIAFELEVAGTDNKV